MKWLDDMCTDEWAGWHRQYVWWHRAQLWLYRVSHWAAYWSCEPKPEPSAQSAAPVSSLDIGGPPAAQKRVVPVFSAPVYDQFGRRYK